MKRKTRSRVNANEDADSFECPVCFTVTDPVFAFDCGHGLCQSCDLELFCRADDRCPVCRKPRVDESTLQHAASEAFAERRYRALAERSARENTPQTIFFPNTVVIEVNASDFVAVDEDGERRGERRGERPERRSRSATSNSQATGVASALSATSDPSILDVVNALVNTETTPLTDFLVAASALRNQRTRRRPTQIFYAR